MVKKGGQQLHALWVVIGELQIQRVSARLGGQRNTFCLRRGVSVARKDHTS